MSFRILSTTGELLRRLPGRAARVVTHCELGWELFLLEFLVLGGLLRALFIFPEPSFLLFFVFLFCEILMYSSGSRVVVRLISLWVLPPLLLLFCGSVFRSCRGLPPHIKLHSPLGGESGASCVGRFVCPRCCCCSSFVFVFRRLLVLFVVFLSPVVVPSENLVPVLV